MRTFQSVLLVFVAVALSGCGGSKTKAMTIVNTPEFANETVKAQILGIDQALDFSVVRVVVENKSDQDMEFKVSYCELVSNGERLYAHTNPETILTFQNRGFKARYLIPYVGAIAAISDYDDASKDVQKMANTTLQDRIIAAHDLIAGAIYFPPFENATMFITYISKENNRIKVEIPLEFGEEESKSEK